MKGRTPKPTQLLKVQGTYQECRHGDRADTEPAEGWPEKPGGLTPIQEKVWNDITNFLPAECLGKLDTTILRDMMRMYGVYCDLMSLLEEDPTDAKTLKNALAVWDRFWKCAQEFGLTPIARTRLKVPGGSTQSETIQALNKLIESR